MSLFNAQRRKPATRDLARHRHAHTTQIRHAAVEALETRRLLSFAFQPGIPVSAQSDIANTYVADMNGDNKLDLVTSGTRTSNQPLKVSILLGNGDGTFQPAQQVVDVNTPHTGATFSPVGSVGDLNRDGNLDFVIVGREEAAIYVLNGNGNGTFAPPIRVPMPASASFAVSDVIVGDFNNNGWQDVAVGDSRDNRVVILDGGPTLGATHRVFNLPSSSNATLFETADFDQDGVTDLAITTTARTIVILRQLNQQSGVFRVIGNFLNSGQFIQAMRAGPLLGPGSRPGLTIASVSLGGTNQTVRIPSPLDNTAVFAQGANFPVTDTINGDFNRDGFDDLIIGSASPVGLLSGTGLPSGDVSINSTQFTQDFAIYGLQAGDFNGDGLLDVVGASAGNSATVFLQRAQSLVVTTTVDEDNGNAFPDAGTGTSLREAFNYARTLSGNQTITFAPALGNANAVINVTGAPLVLDGLANPQNLTIRNSTGTITLRGDGTKSLFDVRFLGNLTLEHLNITNFRASHSSGNGGVVHVAGFGTLNVSNSTFYGNSAAGEGSAIYSAASGVTFIRNSTFNGNAGASTIAIDSTSTFGLQNNTIVGNSGGVRAVAGTLGLRNNIITGNGGADLPVGTGTFAGDRNIIQTGPLGGLTNTINVDPLVGPLANNGGRTLTMLPSQTSPAIDAGVALSLVTTDQRGVSRPQLAGVDIGAVELAVSDLPGVTTPDSARWFLFGWVGPNQRIFRQAPGQSAVEVGGLGTSIGLQADGNVVVRDANGSVFTRVGSANGFGSEWVFRRSVLSADGATWFFGTDGTGGNFNIYRWSATGAVQSTGGQGIRLGSADGAIVTVNSNNELFRRVDSNGGLGTGWFIQTAAFASDNSAWFVFTNFTGGTGFIFRFGVDGTVTNTGGAFSAVSRLSGGTIIARDDAGIIFVRPGSSSSVGGDWTALPRVNTLDGAAWFLGTESTTADQRIYRWAGNSSTATEVGGQATALSRLNDGSIIVRDSTGSVYVRLGSASGTGSEWSFRLSVLAGDGATWFLSTESAGDAQRIYRWASTGNAVEVGGLATSIARQLDGNVVVRDGNGSVLVRPGSSSGVGSDWVTRPFVLSSDNATWFLGTDTVDSQPRIYRWSSIGRFDYTNGWGTRLTSIGGSIFHQNSGGAVFFGVDSASSLNSTWALSNTVIAGDGATWFVADAAGQSGEIFRWATGATPESSGGAGVTLATTPAGAVRTTTSAPQTFERIGSSTGLGTEWRLLSESLVVTTIFDENDFSSSANLGTGTSLREAIEFANANPGPDTITFAPGLIAAGQAVELAFGATGLGDDTALRVLNDLTIDGSGATISYIGAAGRRLFQNTANSTLTLHNLTLTGGNVNGDGGAVLARGDLVVDQVRFQNNTASGTGGAIDTSAQTTVIGSTFTGNSAGEAGAIQNTGTLNISTSTFASNASGFNGGALRLFGTTTIDRSTFDANTVVNEGGAFISFGSLMVTNSTFANNGKNAVLLWEGSANLDHVTIAYNTDGGLLRVSADTKLRNSIVAGNAGFDQIGMLNATSSNNLLNVSADQAGLGALLNHGGPTATIALLPGSPAIDAGLTLAAVAVDQRGIARPQVGAADIGAFESRGFAFELIAGNNQSSPLNANDVGNAAFGELQIVISSAFGEPVTGGTVTMTGPATGASISPVVLQSVIGADGIARFIPRPNGVAGTYALSVSTAGALAPAGVTLTNTYDPVAPTSVGLLSSSDTGASNNDGVTRLNNNSAATSLQFAVEGTMPGMLIRIYANDILVGSAVASGAQTIVTTDGATPLPEGVVAITATQTLPGYPESAPTPIMQVTIDSTAPLASWPTGPAGTRVTAVSAIDLQISEAVNGLTVANLLLTRNGMPVALTGVAMAVVNGQYRIEGLSELTMPRGSYELSIINPATASDLAGNTLTVPASLTWRKLILGDMNDDGAINNLDIAPFVQGLTDPAAFETTFGYSAVVPGDINNDGAFNNLDIAPFVALLTGGRPTASPSPTPTRLPSRPPQRLPAGDGLFGEQPLADTNPRHLPQLR